MRLLLNQHQQPLQCLDFINKPPNTNDDVGKTCVCYCCEGDNTDYPTDHNRGVQQVQHGSALVRNLEHGLLLQPQLTLGYKCCSLLWGLSTDWIMEIDFYKHLLQHNNSLCNNHNSCVYAEHRGDTVTHILEVRKDSHPWTTCAVWTGHLPTESAETHNH